MTKGVPDKTAKNTPGTTPTSSSADDHRCCPADRATVGAKEPSIDCDNCSQWYHSKCTGLTADVFDLLVGITSTTGWGL